MPSEFGGYIPISVSPARIFTERQFVVLQESSELPPIGTVAGSALKELIVHKPPPAGMTVTVTGAVGVAVPSVAVRVYEVVLVRDPVPTDPERSAVESPPPVSVMLVQFDVSQVRVAEPPEVILVGEEVNELIVQGEAVPSLTQTDRVG